MKTPPPAVLEPPPVQTSAPAPKPAGGLKKISFGKAPKKKEDTGTAYPVFDDPQVGTQVTDMAARIKSRAGQIEALQGANETDKAELKMLVTPFYFTVNHNKSAPPSSIRIPCQVADEAHPGQTKPGEVLVTFMNRYYKLEDDSALVPVLGDKVGDYFRQTFTGKVNGEELPAGKEQEIVDALNAVLEAHGALAAIEWKEEIKPTKEFHVARHRDFTPAQNLAIEQVAPIVAMVKTKGREK